MNAEQISDSVTLTAPAKVGVVAAGASAAPAPIYGAYLTTHGVYALSYAEWIQVLGSIYVATLLVKMIVWPVIQKIRGARSD